MSALAILSQPRKRSVVQISESRPGQFASFAQCWMVLIQSDGLCKLHRSLEPPTGRDYSLRPYLSIQDGEALTVWPSFVFIAIEHPINRTGYLFSCGHFRIRKDLSSGVYFLSEEELMSAGQLIIQHNKFFVFLKCYLSSSFLFAKDLQNSCHLGMVFTKAKICLALVNQVSLRGTYGSIAIFLCCAPASLRRF
jgi:hypothetical protein